MKKRLISLCLALAFVLAALPGNLVSLAAEELANLGSGEAAAQDSAKQDPVIGKRVKVVASFGQAYPTKADVGGSSYAILSTVYAPAQMVIEDVLVKNGVTYYQLYAAEGYDWPSYTTFADGYWVKAEAVKILVACGKCGVLGCEKAHDHWCGICQKDDCGDPSHTTGTVTDGEGNPVLDASGKPLTVTVAGELPEGAVVQGEKLSAADIGSDVGIFDISMKDADGNKWQPAPGETVQVSIPVFNDADRVTVVHFLEDPEIIKWALENGKAEKFDVSEFAEDENFGIIESAVKAYQTACNTTDLYVVVEQFDNVAVVNGVAVVDAQGFSIFTSTNPIQLGSDDFSELPDKVYVRPDEWFELKGATLLGGFSITSGSSFVETIDGGDFELWSSTSIYVHVKPDVAVGSTFKIKLNQIFGFFGKTVTFEVVRNFDYGNVYIGVVGPDTPYPNEISTHTNSNIYQYYTLSGLQSAANKAVYSTLPNATIDVIGVRDSNLTVMHDTKTVYGIADTTGAKVTPFLREGFDAIAADILAKYFANNPEQAENYRVVPYVVKHETIGANVGWYVNCKIELKATYLLKYDYNFPEGFDEFDIISGNKPNDRNVSTQGAVNGVVQTTVDAFDIIKLENTLVNPDNNRENNVKVELVGWALTPDVLYTDADSILAAGDSVSMNGNTTLYAVWKVTEGGWEYTKFNWIINNSVVNQQNAPIDSTTVFQYTISASGAFPAKYKLYDKTGALIEEKSFGENNSFTLSDGQYIIIENVAVNGIYSVTETLPVEGHDCEIPSYDVNTEAAKVTGRVVTTFVNKLQVFTITFNPDNGESEWDVEYYYGDTIVLPADPVKYGYDFMGWNGYTAGMTMPAENLTFVADWERALADLTISVNSGSNDQNFVFVVTDSNNKEVTRVALHPGKKSVVIKAVPVDAYTVTPLNGWAWRQNMGAQNVTVDDDTNEVQFTWSVTDTIKQWLNGYSYNKMGG